MDVQTFRKRPVEVQAIHYTGATKIGALFDFIQGAAWETGPGACVKIETLEGTMIAQPGDWIIRGVAGEYYPCKPDIFAQTYEAIDA